jgi:hypothetical protein
VAQDNIFWKDVLDYSEDSASEAPLEISKPKKSKEKKETQLSKTRRTFNQIKSNCMSNF